MQHAYYFSLFTLSIFLWNNFIYAEMYVFSIF